MREVKFRGRRISNGEWVYGSLVIENGVYYIFNGKLRFKGNKSGRFYGMYVVDPETVGQYVGQKDKKGKEIYEGDILYGDDGLTYIVKADRCHFYVMGYDHANRGLLPYRFYDIEFLSLCEIIGNIHDNPELLEVS